MLLLLPLPLMMMAKRERSGRSCCCCCYWHSSILPGLRERLCWATSLCSFPVSPCSSPEHAVHAMDALCPPGSSLLHQAAASGSAPLLQVRGLPAAALHGACSALPLTGPVALWWHAAKALRVPVPSPPLTSATAGAGAGCLGPAAGPRLEHRSAGRGRQPDAAAPGGGGPQLSSGQSPVW